MVVTLFKPVSWVSKKFPQKIPKKNITVDHASAMPPATSQHASKASALKGEVGLKWVKWVNEPEKNVVFEPSHLGVSFLKWWVYPTTLLLR